jgi:hypothetical protein
MLGAAQSADAAPKWPAQCKTIACVNDHMNALKTQADNLKKAVANLAAFDNCFVIMPVTPYDGYVYDDGSGTPVLTTALDYTVAGQAPDFWMAGVVPGTCGAPTTARPTATAASSRKFHLRLGWQIIGRK